jgi:transcription elongation factor Elf1
LLKYDVECGHCGAELEVEVTVETNETLSDDAPEDVTLSCPKCGGSVTVTLDSGAESAEIRPRQAATRS